MPLELQHLCARYLPTMDQMRIKKNILRISRLKTNAEQLLLFLDPRITSFHLLTCHICTGSSRSSRHRTAPPPPPPPTPRSAPSPSTPWSQLSVDGLSAVYITRELTRHWVSRARKSLPSANRQTHQESFRFQQFCEKPSIVSVRRENTVIISTHSLSTHLKNGFPRFPGSQKTQIILNLQQKVMLRTLLVSVSSIYLDFFVQ